MVVADPLRDGLHFNHAHFAIEDFVKQTLRIKLDDDSVLCPQFARTGSCPLSHSCPLRHTSASPLNFLSAQELKQLAGHSKTVCKHWLRGLCKKGNSCEFMHEYNLRKMSECWFFAKYGFCSNGDECMYLHVTERMRVRECEAFRKGFCKLGPLCPLKHLRLSLCPNYLAGFCPLGPQCNMGHAKFDPSPSYPPSSTRIPDVSGARFLPEASFRAHRLDWLEFAADDRSQRPVGGAGFGAGGAGGGGAYAGNSGKDLSKVVCFKCNQNGHFANTCNNASVPGQRGGIERVSDYRQRQQNQQR